MKGLKLVAPAWHFFRVPFFFSERNGRKLSWPSPRFQTRNRFSRIDRKGFFAVGMVAFQIIYELLRGGCVSVFFSGCEPPWSSRAPRPGLAEPFGFHIRSTLSRSFLACSGVREKFKGCKSRFKSCQSLKSTHLI